MLLCDAEGAELKAENAESEAGVGDIAAAPALWFGVIDDSNAGPGMSATR